MNSLKNRALKLRENSEEGFSLIDVVITVAIIVALSVGGFVSYAGLIENAKQGAVNYAASNVYTAAAVYENDTESSTTACTAIDEYNSTSNGISVELHVPKDNPDTPGEVLVYYGEDNVKNETDCN